MGRIPQLFGHTVLAASMLAGGAALLNAGRAMAAGVPCTGAPLVTYEQIAGTPSSGTCTSFLPPDEVDVLNLYSPVQTQGTGTVLFSLTSAPGKWWTSVELDSTHQGTGVSVTKELYGTWDGVNLTNPITLSAPLVSTDGSTASATISGQPSVIYVKDSYTVGPNGGLVSINNEFVQTPGPLPILGAGAAFGFSRKLRGRIKAARLG